MKALAFSLISVSFMSLVLTACGSKDDEEETAATSTYTYEANTKAIINANCIDSGCHNLNSPYKSLTSLADVKKIGATAILGRLQATDSTAMPKDKPEFKDSEDAKILIDWLKGGADLK